MKITPIKTHKIAPYKESIFGVLDKYIRVLHDDSIIVVTSKIVSVCEGSIIKTTDIDKEELIEKEADLYLPPVETKYNYHLTIKNNLMVFAAGIDESNGNGFYILWPQDPQKSANSIRSYLKNKFQLKRIGVLITDSKTTPLRAGTTGISLTHSGFAAVKSYIGKPDIFGRNLKLQKVNMADSLASAAVTVMGEGNEQTPIALIEDVSFVQFQDRNPTKEELGEFHVPIQDDLYSPLIQNTKWQKKK
ncbi:hypothetical protein A2866_00515 [Candidatus Roizmanbacteria bacterium RIFCSPHIGHO2_01_FULL_39_8]|uniref:Coenzyme F420:L-glutamate ligase-like domain-containing protein n=3 Tax=Candidatus Roizmaniibacteriota TaxID=1752723 RepID=A0A1F7GG89_9BACT|nr:MAG: hypothetical protein A2866_00515 [Candidatus Roizmanbacteria bacterium RIFCSPHIGHO2_01_FULL_39_8]OGK28149.1 MAG: hypothetical protein A3C28_05625 [Candidatus Roizmanbacteria bacterium RIFCSPHIGHO2_02_FULL_39_9]OGK37179.1 MAG: hypothetical protein A3F60_03655 [Candidatus Roizmanbacteria bacterium RIFCSPHIGHO2_12_FULL_39_8]